MSAYAKGQATQVISFAPAGSHAPVGTQAHPGPDTFEHLPSLPQIAGELESYFNIARQIEAALVQERSIARKYREELRDLQAKYSRFVNDVENRNRDIAIREERLKNQFNAFQNADKSLREQIREQAQQIENFQEERKKSELDVELLKSTVENYKNREEGLKRSQHSLQANEKFRIDREERLKREFQTLQYELQRYKAAWSKVSSIDQKAKQVLDENYENKRKLEELTETVAREKRLREDSDESIKKEKREKQLALSCLHAAEARLAQVSRELEALRDRMGANFEGPSVELQF